MIIVSEDRRNVLPKITEYAQQSFVDLNDLLMSWVYHSRMTLKPFDTNLNRAIMLLAPVHQVRDAAPQTWRDVSASANVGHGVVVWSGEAQHSIYGDSAVNYAFRAWHDSCHLAGSYEFTIAGEEAAVADQCAQLRALYPRCPQRWLDLIACDVLGVVYTLHNAQEYVADQRASVAAIMALPGGLLSLRPRKEIRRYAYGE